MPSDINASNDTRPWDKQFTQVGPEPWSAGYGILFLSAVMWVWYASLIWRFTTGDETEAATIWLAALAGWLGLQTWFSRKHLPERYSGFFSTILQAVVPTVLTVALVFAVPDLKSASASIVSDVGILELVAVHILRLAAWGTIAKYMEGQLPKYFFQYASLPDFGFAIFAVIVTGWLLVTDSTFPDAFLLFYSFIGAAAFLGAATTMYFGVPGSALSWRWQHAESGKEAPTFLPFRWPMNLAPSFCGPVFWLAHGLLIAKVWIP